MVSLFVDTTEHLVVGLLDENFSWDKYIDVPTKRSSTQLHALINDFLESGGKTVSDIEQIFLASGPGSYTGMRVSEGMGQIFEWQGTQIYSFYHFEVPRLLGHKEGVWISTAFKGEFFSYEWDADGKEEKKLLSELQVDRLLKQDKNLYSHYSDSLDIPFTGEETSYLVKSHVKELFTLLKETNSRKEPFYYRPEEVEFKPARK